MRLISGLGNYPRQYRFTRHNIGFLAIDRIAQELSVTLKRSIRFRSLMAKGSVGGTHIVLLKPLTYMNRSGEAIKRYMEKHRLLPEEALMICDDVNLDLGRIRIRQSGSSGGHNGLKSIIEHIGTEKFPRLRIGIGNKVEQGSLTDYVLSTFTNAERATVEKVLDVVVEAVKACLADGIDQAMTKFNSISV